MANTIDLENPKEIHSANQAFQGEDAQHRLAIKQALRLYPKALCWTGYFSLGIIMVAFDPQLIGQLIATPAFQNTFGTSSGSNGFIISALWQMALNLGAPIGQFIGAFCAGYLMEAIGLKKAFGFCNLLIVGSVFIQFFASSLQVLFAGELLAGLVLGCFVVIAPAYAADVAPLPLRGLVTGSINMCFGVGQLIANGVVAGTQQLVSRWAYKIPFAVQWLWPLIILGGYPFAPESPWWLQRQGRLNDAKNALAKLSSSKVDIDIALDAIIQTDQTEKAMALGSTYTDCFKGSNRRRTMISIAVLSIQVISGIYLASYSTYFFEIAGLPVDDAFYLGIGFIALGVVGTLLSWFLLAHIGRRTLYILGLSALAALQFIIGGLDCAPEYSHRPGIAWAESSLMIVWYFLYSLSIGPVGYVVLCEVSAVRVRAKTIAISMAFEAVATIVMTVIFPYMINEDEGNLRGKIGFFFGTLAVLCLIWAYFCLPELKGRTYYELDLLFEFGTPTNQFKTTVITESMRSGAEAGKIRDEAKVQQST